jgi:hypothetical protein
MTNTNVGQTDRTPETQTQPIEFSILESALEQSTPLGALELILRKVQPRVFFYYQQPTADFLDWFCQNFPGTFVSVLHDNLFPVLRARRTGRTEGGEMSAEQRDEYAYEYIGKPEWRSQVRALWSTGIEGWRYDQWDGEVHYWGSQEPCSKGRLNLLGRLRGEWFVIDGGRDFVQEEIQQSRFMVRNTPWGAVGLRTDYSPPSTIFEKAAEVFRAGRTILDFPEGLGWGEGKVWEEVL